jgi:hypothetical protein
MLLHIKPPIWSELDVWLWLSVFVILMCMGSFAVHW